LAGSKIHYVYLLDMSWQTTTRLCEALRLDGLLTKNLPKLTSALVLQTRCTKDAGWNSQSQSTLQMIYLSYSSVDFYIFFYFFCLGRWTKSILAGSKIHYVYLLDMSCVSITGRFPLPGRLLVNRCSLPPGRFLSYPGHAVLERFQAI
jgi:hypothetical protein